MTTTDTDALAELIYRETFEARYPDYIWGDAPDFVKEAHRARYAPVLPIVAEEVRKAKAEAWDEGWEHRDTPDEYAWDGEQDVPLVPSRYVNPYRETGDQ